MSFYIVLKRKEIIGVIKRANGNRAKAARILGVSRPTLIQRIKHFRLKSKLPKPSIGGSRTSFPKTLKDPDIIELENCVNCPYARLATVGFGKKTKNTSYCRLNAKPAFMYSIPKYCPIRGRTITIKIK